MTNRELVSSSGTELRHRFAEGLSSAEQIAEAFLERKRALDPDLHVFLNCEEERVLGQARDLDEKRKAGGALGSLAGIPIALKDNLCTRGERTTAASRMLADFVPPYDAHVVTRIREEDAILFGKTNLDEFSMGSSCENSAFGPTRNPWDQNRVPGGSSGGSAAAVAADLCPLALGSDTGGSIRQPASLCGIVGLKPTYGRVSRRGLIAFASSLDQIGPLGRTASDCALLLEAISGKDPRDGTSVDHPVPAANACRSESLEQVRIGVAEEYLDPSLPEEIRAVVDETLTKLESLGAEVSSVSLPHSEYAIPSYYLVANSEASSNLARYDGMHFGHRTLEECSNLAEVYAKTRNEGFGTEVKRRILLGTHALSSGYYDAYYLKGLKVRSKIREDFTRAFETVDLVLGPTSPVTAFPLGDKIEDPLAMYLVDILTVSANLAGLPALSFPGGFSSDGLPVGVQLIGRPFEETRLLGVVASFQEQTDFHTRRPSLKEPEESR